jgi:hypothetical protein
MNRPWSDHNLSYELTICHHYEQSNHGARTDHQLTSFSKRYRDFNFHLKVMKLPIQSGDFWHETQAIARHQIPYHLLQGCTVVVLTDTDDLSSGLSTVVGHILAGSCLKSAIVAGINSVFDRLKSGRKPPTDFNQSTLVVLAWRSNHRL